MSGQTGGQTKAWQVWLWILVPLVLFVGLPIGWGMYDDGVFDEDLTYDVTATALGAGDTARVQEIYTEAAIAHGVCYGWRIDAGTGAPIEEGSNLGLGVDVADQTERCPRWLRMSVTYSYMWKEWSSVNVSVTDNVAEVDIDPNVLESHGIVQTLEPEGVSQLADILGSLPMLAAASDGPGGLAPVPAREQTPDPTASTNDELAPVHGVGWYLTLGVSGLLVALGIYWIISGAVKARKARHFNA
ncbi:hypothetical protein [Actinocorallia sp. A-T 12471]|uniref:hypothetical protein n=1 Tax=Actinocorallia sp. A-T 12471 TaxID=3089813 RepID=UPI0029D40D17|nr:hypothetical protein [Actinocorallia sp. A-T 12471]MDX6738684.1 hypothetical protein [Actinocorallia sp. A-T 12471]